MRGRRLVSDALDAQLVLFWGALGLLVGAAVGALVHLTDRRSTQYRGHYVALDQLGSRAYSSSLQVTLDAPHHVAPVLLGVAVGLLAGLGVGLLLSRSRVHPAPIA